MLNFYGINTASYGWSNAFINRLKALEFNTASGTFAFRTLIQELEYVSDLKKQTATQLRSLIKKERYADPIKLLFTIPGIGLVTAITFLTELGDTSRFKRLDHLCNYIGLVPSMHGSGDTLHVGSLTPRKNIHILTLLVESAWTAVGKDAALMHTYHKLCTRMKSQEAIIRIARKLVARMRFVLLNHTQYQLRLAA
jgi:transposase